MMKRVASLMLFSLGLCLSFLTFKIVSIVTFEDTIFVPWVVSVLALSPLLGGALTIGTYWMWTRRARLGLSGIVIFIVSFALLSPALVVIWQIQLGNEQGAELSGLELAQVMGAFGGAALLGSVWLILDSRSGRAISPDRASAKGSVGESIGDYGDSAPI
jgi:hypothetical protein